MPVVVVVVVVAPSIPNRPVCSSDGPTAGTMFLRDRPPPLGYLLVLSE